MRSLQVGWPVEPGPLRSVDRLTAGELARDAWGHEVLPHLDHELRTPLTVVFGWCEMLLSGELGELTDEQVDAVRRVSYAGAAIVDAITLVESTVEHTLVLQVVDTCLRCPRAS